MTKLESRWCDAITQMGCICCLLFFYAPGTPGAVHHLLRGGRRIGHLDTICLCDPGHHQNGQAPKVSRHPTWARFEAAYGTEEFLLAKTRDLVEQKFGLRITTTDDFPTGRLFEPPLGRLHERGTNDANRKPAGQTED